MPIRNILGIDPGLAQLGFGIIQVDTRSELACLDYGCIRTKAKEEMIARFGQIGQQLSALIDHYSITAIAMEEVYYAKNVKSASVVNQVCGAIMGLAAQKQLTCRLYTPLQIKQATSCYGRASKLQVQKMVQLMLKLDKLPEPDHAADALAAAICHAYSVGNRCQ